MTMQHDSNDETPDSRPPRNRYFSPVRFFKSLFIGLWKGVDTLRKVLSLLLLLFIFGVFFSAMSTSVVPLPSNAALVIRPVGNIVEEYQGDAYERAIAELVGDDNPQTLLSDITDALSYAADDNRIDAVVLDLRSFGGTGLSKLNVIGDAIDQFELSGKPVLAISNYYSQGGYYLAARATESYMHEDGMLFLKGFGAYQNYYKDAIDMLMIDWNVFKVGTHKSAVEPFTRTDMSDQDRQSMTRLLGQLWDMYSSDIEAARQLPDGTIQDLTENMLDYVAAADGNLGQMYVDAGLIDGLVNSTEFIDHVLEYVAEHRDLKSAFRSIDLYSFLADYEYAKDAGPFSNNIAVVVASGVIMNGDQSPGSIGGQSTSDLLRRARFNESVDAVVLRVDSPGGSVFASRQIGDEVWALQEAGKPVIASMSSAAASGGYWISMNADLIYANPATITGSIGVFGMFPTFERTLDAIGINTDGVGTTQWAGELRADRAMSDDAKQLFQLLINNDYDDFISKVAEQRDMSKTDVDAIAQGQVWTGKDAMENGLIDEFGSLDDAIEGAADLAGLDDYGVIRIEQKLSSAEELAVEILGRSNPELLQSLSEQPPSPVRRLSKMIEQALAPMLLFNDPRGSYAHCFCVFE